MNYKLMNKHPPNLGCLPLLPSTYNPFSNQQSQGPVWNSKQVASPTKGNGLSNNSHVFCVTVGCQNSTEGFPDLLLPSRLASFLEFCTPGRFTSIAGLCQEPALLLPLCLCLSRLSSGVIFPSFPHNSALTHNWLSPLLAFVKVPSMCFPKESVNSLRTDICTGSLFPLY